MLTHPGVTIDDLYRVPNGAKAEIVDGELVFMSPSGGAPNYAAGEIFVSLRAYARRKKRGRAVMDNAGFRVKLPNRESFSPDTAYYIGPDPGMRFYDGAPIFAVEVRSEYDYGPEAEREMALKRTDYFAAGALVVWDIDLMSTTPIRKFSATNPDNPVLFRRDEIANAEPAVPGWKFAVEQLFTSDL